jgi:hypothetical protein
MGHQVEHDIWADGLKRFCDRNWARKTRMTRTTDAGIREQAHGLPLNGVTIERDDDGAPRLRIMLGGHTADDPRHLVCTISKVRRVGIYTPTNCCDVLEVEDEAGSRTVVSFGSLTNLGE